MTRSDRLRGLVHTLQTERWLRAADLATIHNVSARTIYRDIQTLVASGIPIVAVPGKGYRLQEDYVLPPLLFTTDEAAALLLGMEYLTEYLDAPHKAAARSAGEKIQAALPDDQRATVEQLKAGLHLVPANAFENPMEQSALPALRRAVSEQRAVEIAYRESGSTRTYTVHPYGLLSRSGTWYLIGLARDQQRVRPFRLAALEAVSLLEEHFERPPGYAGISGPSRAVTVQVLFEPDVARWIREAPSVFTAETAPHPEGVLVTLKVNDEIEVIPWLLSWGTHVRVLEPPSLQRRLAREAAKILGLYRAELTLLP